MLFKRPYIQIAGVKTAEDLDIIISCGVRYIGFPQVLDYHQPDLTDIEARNLIKSCRDKFEPVLITYQDNARDILKLADFLDVNIIQLHSDIGIPELEKLSRQTGIHTIKSVIIGRDEGNDLLDYIAEYQNYTDLFITDTYDKSTGASGATGKTHDWKASRKIVEFSSVPVVLAGGLTPANVYNAVLEVKPFGVDAHTGVEDEKGNKSYDKTGRFVENALRGFSTVNPHSL